MGGNVHNYSQPVYQGDNFYGPIRGGIVGGRNNTNIVNNGRHYRDYDTEPARRSSCLEATRDQLEARRRAKNRVDGLRAKVAAIEAELAAAEAELAAMDDAAS